MCLKKRTLSSKIYITSHSERSLEKKMFVILLCISVVLKSTHLFSPAVCFDFVCNLLKVTAQFSVVWFIISMTEIKLTPDLHVKWTSHQLHLTDTNLVSDQQHRVLKITVTTHNENYQPPSKHACFLPPTGFIERELRGFFKSIFSGHLKADSMFDSQRVHITSL